MGQQQIRFERPTALDDTPSAPGVADVRQRVMVKQHQVGGLADLEATEVLAAERARSVERGDAQDLERRQSGLNQALQLPVWIHPIDAAARNISDGDVVRLFNDRGSCLAGARVTDAIMAGVIKLSTGAWWDPEEPGVPGSLDKHGNPNVLTRDCGTSSLGQACSARSCLVQLERFDDPVPPITAFELPPLVRLP